MHNLFYFIKSIFYVFILFTPLSSTWAMQSEPISKEQSEVIEVLGKRPLSFFHKQMVRAELDFYEAYNAVVDISKFKIICRREARLNTHIKRRACYPQFLLDRISEDFQETYSDERRYVYNLKNIQFKAKKEYAESRKYAEDLVSKNPQLLEKLIALNEKQNLYAAKKAAKKAAKD